LKNIIIYNSDDVAIDSVTELENLYVMNSSNICLRGVGQGEIGGGGSGSGGSNSENSEDMDGMNDNDSDTFTISI
jgi:hypothetical protein